MCRGWRVPVPLKLAYPDVRRPDGNPGLRDGRWSAVCDADVDSVINARYQERGGSPPRLSKKGEVGPVKVAV